MLALSCQPVIYRFVIIIYLFALMKGNGEGYFATSSFTLERFSVLCTPGVRKSSPGYTDEQRARKTGLYTLLDGVKMVESLVKGSLLRSV